MAVPLVFQSRVPIQSLAFSPDGAFLAALVSDLPSSRNTALAWEIETGREVMKKELGPNARMLFVPATGRLAVASGKSFALWDLREGRETAARTAGEPQVLLVALPDGTLGGVAVDRPYYDDEDRPPEPDTIRLTRLEAAEDFVEVSGRDEFQLHFVPKLNALAVLNFEHMDATTMGLWDLTAGECLAGLDNTAANVSEYAWFSTDGLRVAWINNAKGVIRLLEIDAAEKTWKPKWEIPRPSAWANSIDFGARGGLVVAWSSDVEEGTNKVLATHVIAIDAATGQERWRRPVDGKCYDVALSPDESLVAAIVGRVTDYHKDGADAFTLRVFDAATGADYMIETNAARKGSLLIQHRQRINFSPDGKRIAVNHTDHVELWRVVRMPTPEELLKAAFDAMAAALRESDESRFKAAWHAAGYGASLAGERGIAGADVFKLGTEGKWLPKPDLAKAEKLGDGEAVLVPCEIWNWEKEEALDTGTMLLVKQGAAYVALGTGADPGDVKKLAERFLKKEPLEPVKPPPLPPPPAPVVAVPAAPAPAPPPTAAAAGEAKPGWCGKCNHQNTGPRKVCLYCGAPLPLPQA